MCQICADNINSDEAFYTLCPDIREIVNIDRNTITAMNCPNLVSIRNIKTIGIRVLNCPNLIDINGIGYNNWCTIYINNCPMLRHISLSNSHQIRCSMLIERCPSLAVFPLCGGMTISNVSHRQWIYCTVNRQFCKYRPNHKHNMRCIPHYKIIVYVQRAVRRRRAKKEAIKNLDILIDVLRCVVASYI
jgi:hypothetical protein